MRYATDMECFMDLWMLGFWKLRGEIELLYKFGWELLGFFIISHLEVGGSADATSVGHTNPPQRRDLRVVRGRRGGRDGRRPDGRGPRSHRRPRVDLKGRKTFCKRYKWMPPKCHVTIWQWSGFKLITPEVEDRLITETNQAYVDGDMHVGQSAALQA